MKRSLLLLSRSFLPAVSVSIFSALFSLCANGSAQAQTQFETQEYLNQKGLGAINAAEAYRLGYTGRGVTIGVVDSGIVSWHPEFAGKIVPGYDFLLNRSITQTLGIDTDGHGSHVAGILGARRDGVGMHGVAFDSNILMTRYGADDDDESANRLFDRLRRSGADSDEASYAEMAEAYNLVFANAWNYMATERLAVINNSVGFNNCDDGTTGDSVRPCNIDDFALDGSKFFNANELFPDTVAAMRALKNAGTLMVFATGNEQQPHPDFLAGAPALYPELQNNWLAVTAIDVDDKQLAAYANKCGKAAYWCLAAPGSLSTEDDWEGIWSVSKQGGYVQMPGTSMAAPHVTGAVALVKQAFPFFDAYQLQQTILTTATDLNYSDTTDDDQRVDGVYGWGLLNAGKAVRGPAMFNGAFNVNTRGYTGTFSNDISDGIDTDGVTKLTGSLIKNGAGTLILSGNNTYSGGTTVNTGTLRIDGTNRNSNATVNGGQLLVSSTGQLHAPQATVKGGKLVVNGTLTGATTIESAGVLGGSGTLVGNLNNYGTVAPGNSPGTLTVNGNYTSGTGSVLQMEVDGSTYDKLVITGDATIGGTLQLLGGPYRQGQNYQFLEVNGATSLLSGSTGFSAIDTRLLFLTPALTAPSAGSSGVFSLSVSRNSIPFTRYLPTRNQRAVASVLDPLSSSPPAALSDIYDDLLNATADTFPGLMDQLTGEGYASIESSLFTQSSQWTQSISDHLHQADYSPDPGARYPLWVNVQRLWTDLNGSAGSADTRSISNGLYLGGDTDLGAGWRAGAAVGAHEGRIRTDDRSTRTDTNSYTASVYGGKHWRLGSDQSASWNSGFAYTYHDLNTFRDMTAGQDQRLTADHYAHQLQLFTELGYSISVAERLSLQPYVRADWNQLNNAGFTESGGAAALRSAGQTSAVQSLTMGLRSQGLFELDDKTAYIRTELGWRHSRGSLDPSREMRFVNAIDTPFTVNGAPMARNTLLAGLDARLVVGKNSVAGLSYNGQFGNGNTSNAAKLYLNVRF